MKQITGTIENTLKSGNVFYLIAGLLRHYKYVGDLPEYDEFKKKLYYFHIYNKLTVKQIEKIYGYIKSHIMHQKQRISNSDYDFITRNYDRIQSPEIKKCIDKILDYRLHNNLTLYKRRKDNKFHTFDYDGLTKQPKPIEQWLGKDIRYIENDECDAILMSAVSRDEYRKLQTLSKKSDDFEIVAHITLDDTMELLRSYGHFIDPKQIEEVSNERVMGFNETGNLIIYNKIPTEREYRKKLDKLKEQYIRKPKHRHFIYYKSKAPLTEILKREIPVRPYIHRPNGSYTMLMTLPKSFDIDTMKITDDIAYQNGNIVNLIQEFIRKSNGRWSRVNHFNPPNNHKCKSLTAIHNKILALKREVEKKYSPLGDKEDIVRVLTYNGDINEYKAENYLCFIRFFLEFIKKRDLLNNFKQKGLREEMKQLTERFSFRLIERLDKAKTYIDRVYAECFNSSQIL